MISEIFLVMLLVLLICLQVVSTKRRLQGGEMPVARVTTYNIETRKLKQEKHPNYIVIFNKVNVKGIPYNLYLNKHSMEVTYAESQQNVLIKNYIKQGTIIIIEPTININNYEFDFLETLQPLEKGAKMGHILSYSRKIADVFNAKPSQWQKQDPVIISENFDPLFTEEIQRRCGSEYRVEFGTLFTLQGNTTLYNISLSSYILCLYHNNNCVGSVVIEFQTTDKIAMINTTTADTYRNKKINKLLRAMVIIICSSVHDIDAVYSEAINPISAYTLLKYFNGKSREWDEYLSQNPDDNKKIDFEKIQKIMKKTKSMEIFVDLNRVNIEKARNVIDEILSTGVLCPEKNVQQ